MNCGDNSAGAHYGYEDCRFPCQNQVYWVGCYAFACYTHAHNAGAQKTACACTTPNILTSGGSMHSLYCIWVTVLPLTAAAINIHGRLLPLRICDHCRLCRSCTHLLQAVRDVHAADLCSLAPRHDQSSVHILLLHTASSVYRNGM